MDIQQVLIYVVPFIIAALAFAIIVVIAINYHPESVVREYERINNQLKEQKSSLFDYEKLNDFLMSHGAVIHYGKWMEPVKYYVLRLLLAISFFGIGTQYHWVLAVMGTILGFCLPGTLLLYMNQKDNEKMLMQIQTVYNVLIVQIKAGLHVADSLAECYSSLAPGRLRTALEEVAGELFVNGTFEVAISNFNRKFSNSFIDSLCIILLQGKETGKSAELLNDISEQIKDMNKELLQRKKAALERKVDFCMLLILTAFLIFIIYAFAVDIFSAANAL